MCVQDGIAIPLASAPHAIFLARQFQCSVFDLDTIAEAAGASLCFAYIVIEDNFLRGVMRASLVFVAMSRQGEHQTSKLSMARAFLRSLIVRRTRRLFA